MNATSNPSRTRRFFGHVGTALLTLMVIGAAGVATTYGAQTLAARADAVPEPEAAALTPVSVSSLTLRTGYEITRRFTGQIEAGASVPLSFELGGRMTALTVAEGDIVTAGQEVARLDTALLMADRARLDASRAALRDQLEFAEKRAVRATSLNERGFASQEVLDQTQSNRNALLNEIASLDAAIDTVDINLEKSVITAPFDGRVSIQHVDAGSTLGSGQAVVTLMETARPEVRVGLPLSVDTDALAEAQFDIAGTLYDATLMQVRPDLDPLTRTRTALFALEADAPRIVGQTATLVLPLKIAAPGAWVPMDALQEGAGSLWTVLVVDDGTVRTAGVEVLHAEDTRAYVQGSFSDGAALIRSGAHRVVPGQQVAVLDAEG